MTRRFSQLIKRIGIVLSICLMTGCPSLVQALSAQEANVGRYPRMLFIGNSHTTRYDIPITVAKLIDSKKQAGEPRPFSKTIAGGILKTIERQLDRNTFTNGDWDVVVLQGQEISVSGKYHYSTEAAVRLAEAALDSDAKVIWFSEWAWRAKEDSTDRILGVYQKIKSQVNGKTTIAPVGLAWRAFSASQPKRKLLSSDGNHANRAGAFLSALVLYQVITGEDCTQLPVLSGNKVKPELQAAMKKVVSKTVKQFNAIQEVLAVDGELGAKRNDECRTKTLSQTIRNYVKGMREIDMSGCPRAFQSAFKKHIDAWEDSIGFFDSHNELRGEMHDLFGQIKLQGKPVKAEIEKIEEQIWGTWAQVESASKQIE